MNQASEPLNLLLLRHGKTNYTGKPNDLTPEGELHVRQVADESVLPWICRENIAQHGLVIISSPAPRATYTAAVVAEVLGYAPKVLVRDGLQPMIWRDPNRALAACKGLSGKGYVDYETEPVFADPSIFETPSEVRTRWYAFLASYIRDSFRYNRRYAIFVSHYEVLCSLVLDLFGVVASEKTALQYVEPILLSISVYDASGLVLISGNFRGQEAIAVFDLWDHSIERRL